MSNRISNDLSAGSRYPKKYDGLYVQIKHVVEVCKETGFKTGVRFSTPPPNILVCKTEYKRPQAFSVGQSL